jgi:allantoinase
VSLCEDYLKYVHRNYGMDQERYPWSEMASRPPLQLPNNARVALWVIPTVEWFPLNMTNAPVKMTAGLARPYPDYWNYTLRDYGLRHGIFRIFRVLDELGIKASVAINSAVAKRHPYLVEQINSRDWEIIAHGVDMNATHHSELTLEEEAALVDECLGELRKVSTQPVRGWLSPAKSQSFNTPDLLAQRQVDYMCDWSNDEQPYAFRTDCGELVAMPHPFELDDQHILINLRQTEEEFLQQVMDHFDWLYNESRDGSGRIMAISLHSWVSGQAFRAPVLKEALEYIIKHKGVWSAFGSEIADAVQT